MRCHLSLLLILTSFMVYAQSEPDREITMAVESLRKAMLDPEKSALEKLAHTKLSYGHSSGKIEDKNAFIHALVTGESDFTELAFNDQTIEVIGDVALVRHKLTGKTNDKGKQPGTVSIGVLLVWYKEGDTWKLAARQAFKL
jgi:hypothetical protein